jgi:uncharacterized protein (UPF0333 family)
MKKGQVSFELVFVFSFILFFIIPAIFFFFFKARDITWQSNYNAAISYLEAIYSNSFLVYYSGNGSYIVMDFNVPEGIKDLSIFYGSKNMIVMEMQDGSKIFKQIPFNITIKDKNKLLTPGIKNINISYNGNEILISSK